MHIYYFYLNGYPLFRCFPLLDLESTLGLTSSADTHFELSPEARAQADLKFTYVLGGWEGSAHDAVILADALECHDGLRVPQGTN